MKLKSNSGAKKRFKLTGRKKKNGGGIIVGSHASRGHLLLQKNNKKKALKHKILSGGDARQATRALPYL